LPSVARWRFRKENLNSSKITLLFTRYIPVKHLLIS
jgi:hypothetical protein